MRNQITTVKRAKKPITGRSADLGNWRFLAPAGRGGCSEQCGGYEARDIRELPPYKHENSSRNWSQLTTSRKLPEIAIETNAPPLLDLTIDNITPNAVRINSQSGDARLTYLMARLTTHLHDFARETRLSTDEWTAALRFLTD
ncbi:hypothetical protein QQZ08_010023 [Neonectria magnoliae]|uniref:Catechol dioxygenase N-terminal domain-containing protein n=1 Tax=Neonectria magnoliae TaxID=2732573 RepID=A0ABR1HKH7_9HYPO